jgi:hypothetical protein
MSTTEQTTKRNYANYKVFGFWLAKSFKDQGIIDQTVYDTLIKSQELHGTKEAQDEFYGKFLESIPTITQELKDLTKVEKESNKEAEKAAKIAEKEAAKAAKIAEKEAAKAAKIAEKEAEKAAKIAEKEAAKETAKAEKLAKRTAAKETAKAVKKMTKDVEKAESTIVADSDDEKTSTRPSTPVLDTEEPQVVVEEVSVVVEEPQVVVEEVSVVEEPQVVVEEVQVVVETAKIIEAETDKLMDGLLQEVLADSAAELSKEEYVEEVGEALYLEVTDPKKKKTMYIRRPVQINNILFADTDLKEQIKGFCVLADAKEVSDPIFQYQRGKKTK